jgi:hypothetical protein
MFALRCFSMRYGLALVTKPIVRIGAAAVGVDPKPELVRILEQPVEQPVIIPLATKVRKKPDPKSYAHLLAASVERGKATDKAILDVLFSWEKNSVARWGTTTNIRDGLALRGINLSIDTIRDHVTALAKRDKLCIERQILDPQRNYVTGRSNILKYLYVYLVALNGDKGERGMVDFVIRYFCESYIERDEKGRFLGLY